MKLFLLHKKLEKKIFCASPGESLCLLHVWFVFNHSTFMKIRFENQNCIFQHLKIKKTNGTPP